MAVIVSDNLNAGTGAGWTWTGGGPNTWNQADGSGGYCYRTRFASPVYRTVTAADNFDIQADIKFDSAGHEGRPVTVWDGSGNVLVALDVLPNQDKARLYIGGSIVVQSAALGLTYTNWNTFRATCYIHDTLGVGNLYANGSLVATFSGDTRTGAATFTRVGWTVDVGGWTEYQEVDNFSYSDFNAPITLTGSSSIDSSAMGSGGSLTASAQIVGINSINQGVMDGTGSLSNPSATITGVNSIDESNMTSLDTGRLYQQTKHIWFVNPSEIISASDDRLWRLVKINHEVWVLVDGTVVSEVGYPSLARVAAATYAYRGGARAPLSEVEKTILEAAGYSVNIEVEYTYD